jgi:hypothetical protein
MIRKEYNVPVEQLTPDQPVVHVQTPGLVHAPLTHPDEQTAEKNVDKHMYFQDLNNKNHSVFRNIQL